MALYADDLLLASSDIKFFHWLKTEFCKRCKMEECGEGSVSLGIGIGGNRSKKNLHLSQIRHSDRIHERFSMASSKPVVTPIDGNVNGPAMTENE